jgi:hypothetical protein
MEIPDFSKWKEIEKISKENLKPLHVHEKGFSIDVYFPGQDLFKEIPKDFTGKPISVKGIWGCGEKGSFFIELKGFLDSGRSLEVILEMPENKKEATPENRKEILKTLTWFLTKKKKETSKQLQQAISLLREVF